MAAPPTEHEILDVNRRYHDVAADEYDAKWGISFGEIGRRQVLGKLTQAARAAARAVRALAGDRRRDRLLHAEPDAGGRRARGHLHGHQPRDAGHARATTRRRWASTVETVACDAAELPFDGRDVRPRARPRRAAPPAGPRPRVRRVPPGAQAGRDAVLRRRAVAARATASPPCPKRAAVRPRRCGAARCARRRRARSTATRATPRPSMRWRGGRRARVRPGRPRGPGARRGLHRRPRARRGAAGELVRLVQPHARGERRAAATSPGAGSSTPTAATSCCSASTGGVLEPRLPPRIFYNLMLAARKPATEPSPSAGPRARSTCCATRARSSTRGSGRSRSSSPTRSSGSTPRRWSRVGISRCCVGDRAARPPQARSPTRSAACSAPACACSSRCAPASRRATSCRGCSTQRGARDRVRRLGGRSGARSSASSSRALYRADPEWVRHPAVRRDDGRGDARLGAAVRVRAAVYAVLILRDKVGCARGRAHRAWAGPRSPCCSSSYRYVPRRLAQLGATDPHAARAAVARTFACR